MTDRFATHENARHENVRCEKAGHKNAGYETAGPRFTAERDEPMLLGPRALPAVSHNVEALTESLL